MTCRSSQHLQKPKNHQPWKTVIACTVQLSKHLGKHSRVTGNGNHRNTDHVSLWAECIQNIIKYFVFTTQTETLTKPFYFTFCFFGGIRIWTQGAYKAATLPLEPHMQSHFYFCFPNKTAKHKVDIFFLTSPESLQPSITKCNHYLKSDAGRVRVLYLHQMHRDP
jgi:hypothetical protein